MSTLQSILEAFECPICKEVVDEPVFNPGTCAHVFCSKHLDQFFDGGGTRECPTCYQSLGGRRNLVRDVQIETFLRAVHPVDVDDEVDLSVFARAPPITVAVPAQKSGTRVQAGRARVQVTEAARKRRMHTQRETQKSIAHASPTCASEAIVDPPGRRRSSRLVGGLVSAAEHSSNYGARLEAGAGSKRRRGTTSDVLVQGPRPVPGTVHTRSAPASIEGSLPGLEVTRVSTSHAFATRSSSRPSVAATSSAAVGEGIATLPAEADSRAPRIIATSVPPVVLDAQPLRPVSVRIEDSGTLAVLLNATAAMISRWLGTGARASSSSSLRDASGASVPRTQAGRKA